jgi:FkbM family methyltransferase
MKLSAKLRSVFREWLGPHRKQRRLARKALGSASVERASFGECLSEEDRIELLAALIEQIPENQHSNFLHQVGFSRSQLMQDLFVLSELSDRGEEGFFVEFGAANGVALSNTWLLEKRLGWKGILAEPARCWHAELARNRGCIIETDCIWSKSGEQLNFDEVEIGEFSTLSDFAQVDQHAQTRKPKQQYQVPTISLNDLLHRHGAPAELDYLSIDTEGSEYDILKEFNFNLFPFKVITCEHNFTPRRQDIKRLLEGFGYRRKHEQLSRFDDWYVLCR